MEQKREIHVALIPHNKSGIIISKLCGALATDGTIYTQRKLWNGYRADSYYFELTDEWFDNVSLVSKWTREILGKNGSIKPNKGSFRFRIGSKDLVSYFHRLGFPYGEKCSIVEIPEEIMNSDNKYKLPFVSAAIMFDGSVKLDGTIEFTTISKKLRNQMVLILKENNVKVVLFERRFRRWSNKMKYGFYSKNFKFFLKILEGPKKTKLDIIRGNKKIDIEELLDLFPSKPHSKAPVLRGLYEKISNMYPDSISFKSLKEYIENKYKVSFHRNTISLYLNLLVKCDIINRGKNRRYSLER